MGKIFISYRLMLSIFIVFILCGCGGGADSAAPVAGSNGSSVAKSEAIFSSKSNSQISSSNSSSSRLTSSAPSDAYFSEPEMISIPGAAFSMSKYEITFDQYDFYAAEKNVLKPSDEGWGRGRRPVINVNHADAKAFAAWLSQKTGRNYRLPTENEWNFAANNASSIGELVELGVNNANCKGCGSQWDNIQTAPTGSFPANKIGLFDIFGNVSEWTLDCSIELANSYFVDCYTKGGSWKELMFWFRSTQIYLKERSGRYDDVGFRLVRDDMTPAEFIEPDMISIPGTNYSISKYEITFAQYDAYAEESGAEKPYAPIGGRGNYPVTNVTWNEAAAYANWLSNKTGKNYRLPTEQEWRFTLSAGITAEYLSANNANCADCNDQWFYSSPVGSYSPNGFGLFDMYGNVAEWTSSCWWDGNCSGRMFLGGSWGTSSGNLINSMGITEPSYRGSDLGFRVLQDL